jgi:hypothetical protein
MRPGWFVGFLCGPRGGGQIGLDTLKSVVAEEFASTIDDTCVLEIDRWSSSAFITSEIINFCLLCVGV